MFKFMKIVSVHQMKRCKISILLLIFTYSYITYFVAEKLLELKSKSIKFWKSH